MDDSLWTIEDRGRLPNRPSSASSGFIVHRPSSIVHRPLVNFTGRLQSISHAAHATNQAAALVAQLLSQVADMYVYHVRIAIIIVAPHSVQDHVAGEHLSRF